MANSNLGRLNDTKSVIGSVRRGDRFGIYQFRLNDRSSSKGTLGNLAGGDADLELLNSSRQRIAKSTTPGADSITQTLDAGVCFLQVKQRSGSPNYRLSLSNAPLLLPDTVGNQQGTAKQISAGTFFVRVFPNAPNQSTPHSLNAALTPLKLFGLTEQNNLIAFNADNLNAVNVGSITGLAAGETLVDSDFRATIATAANRQSLNGGLYGLGSTNWL